MTQFYIICTCPLVFIIHIYTYHTLIPAFCRYIDLNCVCSISICCRFLCRVVMCNVCCSQMCFSTHILWKAATLNWSGSHTDDEEVGLLLLHHVSICTTWVWCFSAEGTRVHKSQKKRRQTAGPPLWKPRYCYLVVICYMLVDTSKKFKILVMFRVTNHCACNCSVTDEILPISFHMTVNCVYDTHVKGS
jgi:hypothetical protein